MSDALDQYFSKIQLRAPKKASMDLLEALSTPEGEHHLMWEFFGSDPDQDRDFLFRRLVDQNYPEFYTLSDRRPTNTDADLWNIETKPFEPAFHEGMELHFSLRANATIKKDGSRHGVVMNKKHELKQQDVPRDEWPSQSKLAQQAGYEWIQKRDQSHGFQISEDRFQVERHEVSRFEKRSGREVSLEILDMTGELSVVNPERFAESVTNGIGRSKAYGCGLMLLKLP